MNAEEKRTTREREDEVQEERKREEWKIPLSSPHHAAKEAFYSLQSSQEDSVMKQEDIQCFCACDTAINCIYL